MHLFRVTFVVLALVLSLALATSAAANEPYVPDELEPWRAWVLDGEMASCPLARSGTADRRCLWPGKLQLDVTDRGASFTQTVDSYFEQFVTLPGNTQQWPMDVSVDGVSVAVVARGGRPAVQLGEGSFTVRGRFAWDQPPATLSLAPQTGMIALRVDAQPIDAPRWQGGTLWIRQDQPDTTAQTQNRISVTAYRTIHDTAPATQDVTLRVNVSGDSREEVLGQLLPEGFAPARMDSPLPARLDADGQLRIQARPGIWEITFTARTPGPLSSLTFEPKGENWPTEEIWSYRSEPSLRVTEASSASPVDPTQAGVPTSAQELPAWRMSPGDVLNIEQRQRGLGTSTDNRFGLQRELWLNFDRDGYLARDKLTGSMTREWRLDLGSPLQLQSAQIPGSDSLLVTQNPSDPSLRGVEVRTPALAVSAVSRLTTASGALPVSGWRTNVEGVSTQLYLPPGTRLLAAPGSDTTSGDWAGSWNLLDFFLLLIISVALWRLYAPWLGIAAFAALALGMHESNAPLWSWLFLIAAFAVQRALPDGRLRHLAGIIKVTSIVVIALVAVPFAADQLKLALYPQLERQLAQNNYGPSTASEAVVAKRNVDFVRTEAGAAPDALVPETITVTGSRIRKIAPQELNRYAKSAQVQAGPGVPTWRWRAHTLTWSGPVAPDQTYRLIVLPPWAMSLWRVIMVLLTLGVIGMLVKRDPPRSPRPAVGTAAAVTASALLTMTLASLPAPHASADTPSPEILADLKRRLLTPEQCVPQCIDIERADVRFDGDDLRISLIAHAQADGGLLLPGDPSSWHATTVTVDGQQTDTLILDASGFSLPLERGVHRIELRGALPNANAVTLAFNVNPHHVTVQGNGFEITGLDDSRLPGGALTLIRQRQATDETSTLDAIDVEQFPAFVTIERELFIDLDWEVTTTVTRVTPARSPINLQVPLLAGEAVTSDAAQVEDGRVNVNIPAGAQTYTWTSTLTRVSDLALTAAKAAPWQETWIVNAGASWRLTHSGVPQGNTNLRNLPYWRAVFTPWPGETLNLNIVRPAGVDGPTLAIEQASLKKDVGRRGSESTLNLSYRATKGGQHVITLPSGSTLNGVTADGRALSRVLDDATLALPIVPGEHRLQVRWRSADGAGLRVATDAVDLGIEATNLNTTLNLPRDRWVLLARGPRVGPAVLYWSELAVFILAAFVLARVARTPLKFFHWLALGLGFSTFFWPAFAVVAVSLLAFRWREVSPVESRVGFNLTQIGLAVLLLGAAVALLTTIPLGLLGSPNMHVVGNNSSHHMLQWFVDHSDGTTPIASVLSAPMWLYKGLILVWSLWLAFAVMRWLPWLWRAFNTGGYWRHKTRIETRPENGDSA
ncbi:MAG: hypothetical protein AB8G17_08630 [Gammaproteobacteria bacterium]